MMLTPQKALYLSYHPSGRVEYFSPLIAWLEKQNKGKRCGW
jgi:hypothetical protein